jgi:hypothetical protein
MSAASKIAGGAGVRCAGNVTPTAPMPNAALAMKNILIVCRQ